jgi:UDP-galactopyranose mutase
VSNFQGSAVIHYPDKAVNYTRVVEHKHFDPYNQKIQEKKKTIVSYEYYQEWNEDKECLYPLNDEKNNNLYLKYKELADQEKKVVFAGRLGTYKYYDMKDIIEEIYNKFNS